MDYVWHFKDELKLLGIDIVNDPKEKLLPTRICRICRMCFQEVRRCTGWSSLESSSLFLLSILTTRKDSFAMAESPSIGHLCFETSLVWTTAGVKCVARQRVSWLNDNRTSTIMSNVSAYTSWS